MRTQLENRIRNIIICFYMIIEHLYRNFFTFSCCLNCSIFYAALQFLHFILSHLFVTILLKWFFDSFPLLVWRFRQEMSLPMTVLKFLLNGITTLVNRLKNCTIDAYISMPLSSLCIHDRIVVLLWHEALHQKFCAYSHLFTVYGE